MSTRALLAALAVIALPVGSASAAAKATPASAGVYITGSGFGHGVGLSQYGAAGYAQHGASYQQILRHYYAQTTLGSVNPGRIVTVQLKADGAAAFSGATTIQGSTLKLKATTNYSVMAVHGRMQLVSGGRVVGTFNAPLQVSGPGPVKLIGQGSYRGALVFRPSTTGPGVLSVNSLGLDAYVQGVVAAEMPATWPAQALEAQAVAARTFAVTAAAVGANFEVYDDTRSQVYEGVGSETPATNAAVAATRGQVVEYHGAPVMTYFFASSGGETESVQNVFAGVQPESWLVGEPDPYDDSFNNPYHQWSVDLTLKAATSKLGKLVDGSLQAIKVTQRGVSPRVVEAEVVGSKGTRTVTGEQLRTDLGTPSTWMSFTTISATGTKTVSAAPTVASSIPASGTATSSDTATTSSSTSTTASTGTSTSSSGGVGLGAS